MGGETFLVGLRGAKNLSIAFRIVFRILFRVFQTVFRIDLKIFSGANSFCTRAALTNTAVCMERPMGVTMPLGLVCIHQIIPNFGSHSNVQLLLPAVRKILLNEFARRSLMYFYCVFCRAHFSPKAKYVILYVIVLNNVTSWQQVIPTTC